ncbi:hypothetical protein NDR87_16275 [Nocardia sp. CDC159]|uniref:Uncharacterized protein n=1 Tax=Nocardia pulmonis TaxID=2951408 RepID=A0A9X2E6X2_9NOCA|nr:MULTISPECIES: hypothetical protein [Nocardia]MCM6775349.1 hypothetical protein [Nocardia pulmonis]MCM6787917.1 hypothetical protein [Nocardia sp. CDC159]
MRSSADSAARLRGASVGTASGAVSIAAHALGGGAVAVGSASIALLVAACATTGVVVAAVRGGLVRLMLLLAGGQAIGHVMLGMAGAHRHGVGVGSLMLGAHLVAIPVAALLIRGAEVALGRVSARVRQVAVALVRWCTADSVMCVVRPVESAAVVQWVHCSDLRWRGPPCGEIGSVHPVLV